VYIHVESETVSHPIHIQKMTVLLLYILLMVFLNAYKTLSSPLFQDGAWNFCINLFRLLWVNQIFVLEVLSLFLARLFHHTSDEDGLTALIFYALFALEIFKSKTVQSYIKSGYEKVPNVYAFETT